MERLIFEDPCLCAQLFGPENLTLSILSQASKAHIFNRGNTLIIDSPKKAVETALIKLFCHLYEQLKRGELIETSELSYLYKRSLNQEDELFSSEEQKSPAPKNAADKNTAKSQPISPPKHTFEVKTAGKAKSKPVLATPLKTVIPRNASQERYLELLRNHDIVFALGPAGTGKTYLAVAHAVELLGLHKVKKIILTRPAVEAGEKLGFLPGDLFEKINPYLRPLYDALYDMLPQSRVAALTELGTIEIAPLAFMRGRTLNDSCIILDEAQNTTREQMKMFLTRMGFGSRMIITGDGSQTDLPFDHTGEKQESGLSHARNILHNIPAIAFHSFSKEDVVRHQLVGEIVNAYDIAESRSQKVKIH